MYVILGATGKVGGAAAAKLLALGKPVRAVGRNAEKLAALAKLGAEIAVGSMEDSVFLAKSMVGAKSVFAMIPPDMQTPDIHAHYDKIGTAVVKAIVEAKVTHVVHLSSLGAHLPEGTGPIAGLHRQEQRLNALSGVSVLHLRPGYFMENLYGSIPIIKGMGINGSALRGDLIMSVIASKDVGEVAALRLQKRDFTGKSAQELVGQRDLNMTQITIVIGRAIGKPDLKYVQFPYPDALQGMIGAGMSQSMAENFVAMSRALNEGLIPHTPRNSANTTTSSIEEFAQAFAKVYAKETGDARAW